MTKFWNFFIFYLFFGFILIDEPEIQMGHTFLTCNSLALHSSEIVKIF
jgi:hypothetical protein